ncbi:hypothetical protein [Staphylococcus simulans]|uniref:hypothetical protein n=1 Tax=Staphylococcus simulans TaxID=1286 RepID=UPI0028A3243F|nr:hypothetical protein [Staphylococcus simulans]MDT4011518.1 hypothetical protein [Staphylococcus simulans]
MIKKARKKPVEIEFMQYTGSNEQELNEWSNGKVHVPFNPFNPTEKLFVHTLEGTMRVDSNDYVVKGVHGEFYAVKPDIFYKTYDIVNGDDTND